MTDITKDTPLKFIRRLGEGGFGIVDLVKAEDGQLYARKRIHLKKTDIRNVKREISVLKDLSKFPDCNPLVVCYYGGWTEIEDNKLYAVMIMEFFDGWDVLEYLETIKDRPIDPKLVVEFSDLMLRALKYIHSKGVAHRDIKLANVMYNERELRLIDFGTSCFEPWMVRDKPKLALCQRKWVRGTPNYIAPEIWLREAEDYMPGDIWAFGVMLYFMIKKKMPFEASGIKELGRKVASYTTPAPIVIYPEAPEIANIINSCLIKNPNKRPTAEQLLEMLKNNPTEL